MYAWQGSRPRGGRYDSHASPRHLPMPAQPSNALHAAADAAPALPRPSKTQAKKAMHELQELGAALAALPADRIAALALPESLQSAIDELRRTRSHEGRRRQMQYIGKLMRGADPQPIRDAVAAMQLGNAHDTLALHRAERWRTELIAGDAALAAWAAAHPGADLQQLRRLVHAARKDAAAAPDQRSGRAYRELFRFVRQAQQAEGGED